MLESAVARPFASAGGDDAYIGVFNKAAALFHSLINNHCFFNGNERVSLLAAMVFLGENGYWLTKASDEDLFEFTRQAAAHELTTERVSEIKYISEWFKENCRRSAGEHQLKFHELKEILVGFGFDVSDVQGSTLNIIKNQKVVATLLYEGAKGKEDYDKQYISRLRKQLKLISSYGVDSYMFYGERGFDKTLNK